MEVPCLVEHGMVARFYHTGGRVEVDDVLVRCCVAKEDTCEVVTVEFAVP